MNIIIKYKMAEYMVLKIQIENLQRKVEHIQCVIQKAG